MQWNNISALRDDLKELEQVTRSWRRASLALTRDQTVKPSPVPVQCWRCKSGRKMRYVSSAALANRNPPEKSSRGVKRIADMGSRWKWRGNLEAEGRSYGRSSHPSTPSHTLASKASGQPVTPMCLSVEVLAAVDCSPSIVAAAGWCQEVRIPSLLGFSWRASMPSTELSIGSALAMGTRCGVNIPSSNLTLAGSNILQLLNNFALIHVFNLHSPPHIVPQFQPVSHA